MFSTFCMQQRFCHCSSIFSSHLEELRHSFMWLAFIQFILPFYAVFYFFLPFARIHVIRLCSWFVSEFSLWAKNARTCSLSSKFKACPFNLEQALQCRIDGFCPGLHFTIGAVNSTNGRHLNHGVERIPEHFTSALSFSFLFFSFRRIFHGVA